MAACFWTTKIRVTEECDALIPSCDPYWDQVVLAMHFDGDLVDEKGHVASSVVGGSVSTVQVRHGSSSYKMESIGISYIQYDSADFIMGTQDLTIEGFVYLTAHEQTLKALWFGSINPNGTLGGPGVGGVGDSVPLNQWTHIAYSRNSGVLSAFLNGVKQWDAAFIVNITNPIINAVYSNITTNPHDFYVDDIRITKGIARYTADFDPPTAPFPDVGCL